MLRAETCSLCLPRAWARVLLELPGALTRFALSPKRIAGYAAQTGGGCAQFVLAAGPLPVHAPQLPPNSEDDDTGPRKLQP